MKPRGLLILSIAIITVSLSAAAGDPDNVSFLRSQFAALQNLPPGRQQQLRDLDRDLHALDAESQERLGRVLAKYNHWLAQLPTDDRKRITDAATAYERLKIIEEIKDHEWIETLPKAYRDRYAKTEKDAERRRLIENWRADERERREEWHFVLRNWDDIKDNRLPPVTPAEEAFVVNLESQLPTPERERLRRVRELMQEDRGRPVFLKMLVELADRFPLLPGPLDGPRTYEALPKADREVLEKVDKTLAKKKGLPKELQDAQGRWPDFAIAVSRFARQNRVSLPEPLGPINKETMPVEVRAFITEKLEPTLQKSDAGKRDMQRLKEAEGRWPEYPRTVMDLAKLYKLSVPGWTLPDQKDFWDKFRIKLQTKKPAE